VPVAAHATGGAGGVIVLRGRVVSLAGERAVEGSEQGLGPDEAEAERLGTALAERLLEEGADRILAQVRAGAAPAIPEP
jgi:porphobilinogen deaminase